MSHRFKYGSRFGPLLILLLQFLDVTCTILNFEVSNPTISIANGKRRMDEMIMHSKLPVGPGPSGECWKSALEDLEIGCKFLTEEVQSRMALRFTSCFNQMLSLEAYICEKTTPIQTCLQQLSPSDRATFKDYFLHTQDMCYYLRQEVWQEQTNDAVSRLTDAASDVTVQMVEQKQIQEQIFHSQQESLKVQSNMKKDNEDLYQAVVKVKDVFDDFSVSTREHQLITTEIFDKLSRMQKLVHWIQGEMSLFDAVLFYFGAIVLGLCATATVRTKAARFWLVILFMGCIWSESALRQYLIERDHGMDVSPEDLQGYVWLLRKIAAGVGCGFILVAAAVYRDQQTIQNNMIASIYSTLQNMTRTTQDVPDQAENGEEQEDRLSEDTYSNYSSDDSADNLEYELKILKEDADNSENISPLLSPSNISLPRYFGKEPNDVTSTSPNRPVIQTHRYNFRARSSTPKENPIVRDESPSEFARLIKRGQSAKPKKTPAETTQNARYGNYFSSDDE